MLIWITIVLLLLLLAGLGFLLGGVRALIFFLGAVLGAAFAFPLAPAFKSLLALCGVKNPYWLSVLPPLVAFLVIAVVCLGLSFVVHWKIWKFFKHRTDDIAQMRWDRVNRRLGIPLGVATGTICVFVVGVTVYVLGYLTVQVSASESEPAYVRFVTSARDQLRETGLDKPVAKFDFAPEKYYRVADLLGLLYHNPVLFNRLALYPPFITLTSNSTVQDIAGDEALMGKLKGQASLAELINEAKIQAAIKDSSLISLLESADLDDLRDFLRTGRSPKYYPEKILGRWEVDGDSLVTHLRKTKPDISSTELVALKKIVAMLANLNLTATVDNKVVLSFTPPPNTPPPPAPGTDPNQASAPAGQRPMTPWEQRYGQRPGFSSGAARPAPAAPAAPKPATVPASSLQFSGEGEWQKAGATYRIKVRDPKGKEYVLTGEADDVELFLSYGNETLVFQRIE